MAFTFNDYIKALDRAGPKTTENILQRAVSDPGISFADLVKLEDAADENARKRIARNRARAAVS